MLESAGVGLVGIVMGLVSVTAGGGALVTIPFLMVIGLPPAAAIATSKLAIIGSFVTGSLVYRHRGATDAALLKALAVIALAGSLIGANLVFAIEPATLKIIVVALLLTVLGITLAGGDLGTRQSITRPVTARRRWAGAVMIFLLGVYSGFFGAGFGTFVVFTLVYGFGLSFVRSSAIMSGIALVVVGAALAIFAARGAIDYAVGVPLVVGSTIGGWAGARFAVSKGSPAIRTAFIVMTMGLVTKLLVEVLQQPK